MRRTITLASAVVLLSLGGACAEQPDTTAEEATAPVRPSGATAGDRGGAPVCSEAAEIFDRYRGQCEDSDDIVPVDPDVVVSIYSTESEGPGPGTPASDVRPVPDFEMRTDGTVFLGGDGPFGIDRYRLSDEGIDRVRDLVAGMSTDRDTYGDVEMPDCGDREQLDESGETPDCFIWLFTEIYLNVDGDPVWVEIPRLQDVTHPDELRQHVNDDQVNARLALLDIIAALDELGEQTDDVVVEARAPYTPEEIELMLLPAVSDRAEPVDEDPAGSIAWPLDTPLVERDLNWHADGPCTVVAGSDAADVAGLVERQGVQPHLWTTGAASPRMAQLKAQGLLPGDQPFCSRDGFPPASLDQGYFEVGPFGPIALVDAASWDGTLDADMFEQVTPLEVFAAMPALAAGMIEHRDDAASHGKVPAGAGLTWYDYRVIAAHVDGTRYLDVEAQRGSGHNPRNEPETWRARIDLANERVTALQIDG